MQKRFQQNVFIIAAVFLTFAGAVLLFTGNEKISIENTAKQT